MSSYAAALSYIFTPAAGTISFANQAGFAPQWLKSIINQTRNAPMYIPGATGYGGSFDATGTILALQASVSSWAASDILLFQYDDQGNALTDIQAALQGSQATQGITSTGLPGAVMRSPNIEDKLNSLIAEVRLLTTVLAFVYRESLDLDALKKGITDALTL